MSKILKFPEVSLISKRTQIMNSKELPELVDGEYEYKDDEVVILLPKGNIQIVCYGDGREEYLEDNLNDC